MSVRIILENAMDRHVSRVTYKSIAESTGVCSTLISRYFARQKDLTFYDILKVTRYLTPAEEVDVMRALTYDYISYPKPANVRALLLYLVNAKMYDEMTALGASISAKNRECAQWYTLIELSAKHRKGEIESFDLISKATTVCGDNTEVLALKNLLISYGMHHSNTFTHFFEITSLAEKNALAIKNDYIRDCLHNFVCEQFANAYLYQHADTKKCRFYASMVSRNYLSCEVTSINNEYTMGISYMFEDYGKALTHLTECVRGLRKIGNNRRALTIEQDDIAFLYNYWQIETLQGSEDYDASQQVYKLFLEGELQKAEELLATLEIVPFNTYLKGLILSDDSFLVAACMQFRQVGNELFAQLPLASIKQKPLKEVLLKKIA